MVDDQLVKGGRCALPWKVLRIFTRARVVLLLSVFLLPVLL